MSNSLAQVVRNISRFFMGVWNLFRVGFFGRKEHDFGRHSHMAKHHVCPYCAGELRKGVNICDPPLSCQVCRSVFFDSPQPVATALLMRRCIDGVIEVLVGCRLKGYKLGKMAFPGGYVEPQESVEDAAAREAGEEVVGLEGILSHATRRLWYSVPATTRNEILFFVEITSEGFIDCVVSGTVELGEPVWVRVDDPVFLDADIWAFSLHHEAFCSLSRQD